MYNGKEINPFYAPGTSNTSKRGHLIKYHPEAVVHGIREGEWPSSGAYDGNSSLQAIVREGVQVDRIEPFGHTSFRNALVRFITACDQVSVLFCILPTTILTLCTSPSWSLNVQSSVSFCGCSVRAYATLRYRSARTCATL